MTILDIYSKYNIPPNLIRHQIEVAAVGRYVCDHWRGRKIDQKLVTEALLLHDMGNIIKFKRPFLGELEAEAARWEIVQRVFIRKYGSDVMAATTAIVAELGLSDVNRLLDEMVSVWSEPGRDVSDEARICEYADCCVTPDGISGFVIRIRDLKNRYHRGADDPAIMHMLANGEYVHAHSTTDLKDTPTIDLSGAIDKLSQYQFSV